MFFSLTSADKTPSCKAPNQEISKHMPVLQQSNSSSNLFMCTSSYTVAYFLLFFNMFPVPGGCQIAEKITCGTNISYSILLYSANFDVSAWELVETYFSRKSDFPVVFFSTITEGGDNWSIFRFALVPWIYNGWVMNTWIRTGGIGICYFKCVRTDFRQTERFLIHLAIVIYDFHWCAFIALRPLPRQFL